MKEYIERAQLLKNLGYDETRRADVLPGSTFDIVLKEPAADVAEVVRCRECVHSSMPSGFTQRYGEPGTLSCHFGPCNRRNVNENDFCSYGQQKEAEHES